MDAIFAGIYPEMVRRRLIGYALNVGAPIRGLFLGICLFVVGFLG